MRRAGYSMVGLLVSMACIVVLLYLLLNALNKTMTGQGSARPGTVRSMEDQLKLSAIHQGMFIHGNENRGWYPVPSRIVRLELQRDLDTTANLFSAMIALELVAPDTLVAANEFSGYVEADRDYDYTAYDPASGVYWDDGFRADLDDLSNVSFAHMPLYGERYDHFWRTDLNPTFPVLGNRGPEGGIDDPTSWTYGRDGTWAGHVCFGDGRVEFTTTFNPPQVVFEEDGARVLDNIFAVEDGQDGIDAVLSFTKTMTTDGFELQWD